MESNFSFKDLYDVSLKTTYDIEAGNRIIEEGETIARFDQIQIAGLQELSSRVSANGGFDNRAHVWWETTKEIRIQFSQGVFSKNQLSFLNNAKLAELNNSEAVSISIREILETNENSKATLKHKPNGKVFVYNIETGEKIGFWLRGKEVDFDNKPFFTFIVEYTYDYSDKTQVMRIGQRFINGFLSLEGKTRIKDDQTGKIITGLIKIPKLKLMSDLNIYLGQQASPIVANFNAVGVPVDERHNSYVCEFYYLSNDIDSDF